VTHHTTLGRGFDTPTRRPNDRREIRPLLIPAVRSTVTTDQALGSGWMLLPGNLGYVPVSSVRSGRRNLPITAWTISGTDVTVGEVEAATDELLAEGLGAVARLHWDGATFNGSASAWGPTPWSAVTALLDAVHRLWPDPELVGAVVAATDQPWQRDEWRTGPGGVSTTAPLSGARRPSALMQATRGYAGVELRVDDGDDWASSMRRAIGVDPRPLATRFAAWHAQRGVPATGEWTCQRRRLPATGIVHPAGATWQEPGRRHCTVGPSGRRRHCTAGPSGSRRG
jgi:hypothetical protein